MKTSIPDSGTVVRLDGGSAVVRMKHDGSCRKCGAAAMGLCRGGLMQELAVRNPLQARVGDTVKIGLVQGVQYRGFLLAYVVPPLAFVLGAVGGHFLGSALDLPPADVIGGFFVMLAASFFSFRRLRRLDASYAIEIVHVESDPWSRASTACDEGAASERYGDQVQPGLYC